MHVLTMVKCILLHLIGIYPNFGSLGMALKSYPVGFQMKVFFAIFYVQKTNKMTFVWKLRPVPPSLVKSLLL